MRRSERDPFEILGLPPDADATAIRRARRELARSAHPDVGGDPDAMQRINVAAAAALRRLSEPAPATSGSTPPPDGRPAPPGRGGWGREDRDVPSFTVEALPAETFEALLLAGAALGDIEDDDPPYRLSVRLAAPLTCWCELTVLPDAGASTVSLAVAPDVEMRRAPPIENVRDAWIAELNQLDWSAL